MRVETFYIGYHTISNEHEYLALADTGAIPFADFTGEREVQSAYIGALIDGEYKERTITYERDIRLAGRDKCGIRKRESAARDGPKIRRVHGRGRTAQTICAVLLRCVSQRVR